MNNNLCLCGCGEEVSGPGVKFRKGHNGRTKESNEKKTRTWNAKKKEDIEEIILKRSKTMINTYGFAHSLQVPEILTKARTTCFKNNGAECSFQTEQFQDKKRKTCNEKYGFDSYSTTPEFRQLAREQLIQTIKDGLKNGQNFTPKKGYQEDLIINELQAISQYQILRDQTFIGYFPDGYIKELNLIIEVYEPWHKFVWARIHDPIRQNDLINHLNCDFFIIWQTEWLKDQSSILKNFKIRTKILEDRMNKLKI